MSFGMVSVWNSIIPIVMGKVYSTLTDNCPSPEQIVLFTSLDDIPAAPPT